MIIKHDSLEEQLHSFRNRISYSEEFILDVENLLSGYGLTLKSSLEELINALGYRTEIESLRQAVSKVYNKVSFIEDKLNSFEYFEAEQLEVFAKPPSNMDAIRTKSIERLEPDYLAYKCITMNYNPPLDMFLYYFRYDNFDDRYEILPWIEETTIKLQELAYGASQAKLRSEILEVRNEFLKGAQLNAEIKQDKTADKKKSLASYAQEKKMPFSPNFNDAHFSILNHVYNVRLLFDRLKQNRLIQETDKFPDFKSVFRYADEQPSKSSLHQPITWMGTNAELKHLVQSMIQKQLIRPQFGKVESNNPWQVVQYCFINKNGSQYTPKQLQGTGRMKKGHRRIDDIAIVMKESKKGRYFS